VFPLQIARALGDGEEIGAEEDAGDAVDLEQGLGERRGGGFAGGAVFAGALAGDIAAGDELQHLRIGRGFGLDEHGR
jgi:hypothetical protein